MVSFRISFLAILTLFLLHRESFSQRFDFVGDWELIKYHSKTDLSKTNLKHNTIKKEHIVWNIRFSEDSATEFIENWFGAIKEMKSGTWDLNDNQILFKMSDEEYLKYSYSISKSKLILKQEEILTGAELKAVFRKL